MKLRQCSDGRLLATTKGLPRGTIAAPAIDRVLAKVEVMPWTGCWIFMGATNEAGYGIVGLGGRSQGIGRAHRITYQAFVGNIPDGMFVCHKCDVRCCCNPDHLFLGSAADNTADMRAKGRGSNPPRNLHDVGTHRYNAKLTEQVVREARMRHASGESGYAIWQWLKREYGIVAQASVYRMLAGETWRHV